MALSVSASITKNSLDKFIKMINDADGAYLEWGIFKSAGDHPKADMPVANLQAIHEFRRDSWRRPLFHIQAAKIEDGHLNSKITFHMRKFINDAASGKRVQITNYLDKIGTIVVKDAKDMYGKKGISYRGMSIPPNTDATKKLKGHDNPLLEFGVLKKSVTFTTKRG